MQLSYMRSFSYGKIAVTCIYLNRVNISLIIFYPKMNDWFQGYTNMCRSKIEFYFWQKDIENITYKYGIYFINSENS